MTPAKLLQVHISEHDRWQSRPLYEAVVETCRRLGVAGATVFRGLEGYGDSSEIHRRPIIITVVDSAENIARLAPALEEMMDKGLIAVWDVTARRVEKSPGSTTPAPPQPA
jgi:PII-like signaling protein